jgi:hypothetical protein
VGSIITSLSSASPPSIASVTTAEGKFFLAVFLSARDRVAAQDLFRYGACAILICPLY